MSYNWSLCRIITYSKNTVILIFNEKLEEKPVVIYRF